MSSKIFNFDNSYRCLSPQFFSEILPTPVSSPELVIFNDKLAADLDLNFDNFSAKQRAEIFSGNQIPRSAEPIAQAYAGHQFGNFVILGDGRAILLGEHLTQKNQRFDVQLKGSGRTQYSRRGDGRAALAPMLREYIISEAMNKLKIPTTRSLAVVKTGEKVYRETEFPGAILTRIASSHIRVGTFQFAAALHGKEAVEQLMNYAIKRHFPECENARDFFKKVIAAQADLIVNWLRVGFIHGVMNTDNMSICGETIDYGPCAFLDEYDPQKTFSSIDYYGRYAFANQPIIAQWNLARLAETLLPLLANDLNEAREIAEDELDNFYKIYQKKYGQMMRQKLGFAGFEAEDESLIEQILRWMRQNKIDYTNFFCDLMSGKNFDQDWFKKWQERRAKNQLIADSNQIMRRANPLIIPRNHLVEEALAAANNDDFEKFKKLLSALKNPYEQSDDKKPYQIAPEESEKVRQTFCGT